MCWKTENKLLQDRGYRHFGFFAATTVYRSVTNGSNAIVVVQKSGAALMEKKVVCEVDFRTVEYVRLTSTINRTRDSTSTVDGQTTL